MSADIISLPFVDKRPYRSLDDLPDVTELGQAAVQLEVFYPPARNTFNAPIYNEVPESTILRFCLHVNRAPVWNAYGGTTRTGISLEMIKGSKR